MRRFSYTSSSSFKTTVIRNCSSQSCSFHQNENMITKNVFKKNLNFSKFYERAESDIQTPILKAFLKQKQKPVMELPSTSTKNSLLVASAVLATPSSCCCGNVCTCPPMLKFTGVNSALHRRIHFQDEENENNNLQKKKKNNNDSSDQFVIKGLLKGCAEQNALGAFAASGNHFDQIRGIVICSLDISSKSNNKEQNHQHDECFPCFACRNYLSKVHQFVSKRHSHQVLKLSCVSLKFVESDKTEKEAQENKSEKRSTISVDCISGWNTSFKQEVVVV